MIQAKVIGVLVLIVLIGFGLWSLYHAGYKAGNDDIQVKWDADKIQRDEAQTAALIAYADKIKLAQEQHDHDQTTINDLHDTAGRVRIHLSACTGTSGKDQDGKTRILPDRVDQLFADFQARVGGIIAKCDQLNIDAIRMNGEIN